MSDNDWRPQTLAVRGGLDRTGFDETAEALFMTSGYVYSSAEEAMESFDGTRERYVYSRFRNPTVKGFEDRLAAIEGAKACRATATGMAAVYASLVADIKAGDRIVASRALFGSSQWILNDYMPRFGVETVTVDPTDTAAWEEALAQPAKYVLIETPSNPRLEIIDIAAVSALAHKAGAKVIVDNVFATPIGQKPLKLGADVVVYSTTKHIDGQGRCLGGAILSDDEDYIDTVAMFMRQTGPAISPFNAWVMLKGLETLSLRVERMCENATAVARALDGHPKLAAVIYPGLDSHPQKALAQKQSTLDGSIVAIEVKGGQAGAFKFLNGLRLIDISNNLGDSKSLITHPATTTHQRLSVDDKALQGITPGLVRLSVGLEDAQDLIDDLKRALAT